MPVLTPQELQEISVKLGNITEKFEDALLEDISRRIAKTAGVTDTAEYQILRLKELGYANNFMEKQIAEYTQLSEKEIQQVFFGAAQVSDDFYSRVYQKAGKDFIPLTENEYVRQLISAGIEQTSGELKNFTGSMGFSLPSPSGKVKFKPIAEAYQEVLDLAQFQVSTGVFDYNTAVRRAVKSLTDSGIRFVDYASGHVNRADVAARRATLTGVSQMTGKISLQNAEELETDIVEVTAHAGARPDHAEWQGGWYSLSGKSKKYKSLVDVTGYGTGAGLKGWNCRHDFYPVLDGIDKPTYTEEELKNIDPPPIEYRGKTLTYYECTQEQRKMETAMRKTKREIIGAKGSGDDEQFTVKSVLLRRQREEYNAFSRKANLLTQNERTQVYGFDRSIASKSSWALRKALDNGGKSGIIKNIKLPNEIHSVKGMSDELANEISNSFDKIRSEYNVRFDSTPVKSLGAGTENIPFQFQPEQNGASFSLNIVINSDYDFNGSLEAFQKRIMESHTEGFLSSQSVEDLLWHEAVHVMTFQGCSNYRAVLELNDELMPLYVKGVSIYSDTSRDGIETMAEAFVKKRNGGEIPQSIDDLLNQYIERWKK